jgi:hypothetical protein
VVLVIGVVAVTRSGDGGDPSAATTTSTARPTTTTALTTTTTFVPLGPVLPVQTGASLLFASQSGSWRLLDLDAGTLREVDRGRVDDIYGGLIPVRGGVVVVDGTHAAYRPILTGGDDVDLGDAFTILASGDDDLVWLVDTDRGGQPNRATLVDLRGRVQATRKVGAGGYLPAATVDGPIVGDGGRTFVVAPTGLKLLGVGNPTVSAGGLVLLDRCSEAGRCGPVVVEVRTGREREIPALEVGAGRNGSSGYALSREGDVLELTYGQSGVHVRWADPSGRLVAEGDLGADLRGNGEFGGGFNGFPEFLPDGQGVVWASSSGDGIRVVPNDGGLLIEPLPDPGPRKAERVLVLRP